jgi:hypothetical protein
MSKLRKEVLKVKEGQLFTFVGASEYFTNGRGDYRVDSIYYDNGTQTTNVKFIDDQGDLHWISDVFLAKNFTPTIVKNFRHV